MRRIGESKSNVEQTPPHRSGSASGSSPSVSPSAAPTPTVDQWKVEQQNVSHRQGESQSNPGSDGSASTGGVPACAHCGEPCVVAYRDQHGNVFCCTGCRGAFALVQGLGLQEFYALRQYSRRLGAAQPASQGNDYELFDSSEFLSHSAPETLSDGTLRSRLGVRGIHCSACSWLIENALRSISGLVSVEVNISRHALEVRWDPQKTRLSVIAELMDRLGYSLQPLGEDRWAASRAEGRRLLASIAVAGFLAANTMWIAIALYSADFAWIEPSLRYFFNLVGMILALIAVAGPGRRFLVGAWSALRTRTPHMDLPIALGLSIGSVVGTINAVRGVGAVYFDSLASLVFLLLIGRWLQHHQQLRAAQAIDLMIRLTPSRARKLLPDGKEATVSTDRLTAGDVVVVRTAESIPVDGVVVAGESELDRSLLTGESDPIPVRVGQPVHAGEVNLSGLLQVRTEAVGRETRIGKVLSTIDDAAARRSPIVMLADRIGGYFVVTITTLALGCLVYWWPSEGAGAVQRATALLIVACPCALALATPLALAVAVARAAKAHIFVRDAGVFQRLSRSGIVWLDKTGTLTYGRRRVTDLVGEVESLALAAALEMQSHHGVATAIVEEARRRGLHLPDNVQPQPTTPGGVAGLVNNQQVVVGNSGFLHRHGVPLDAAWNGRATSLIEDGKSPVFVAVDGSVRLLIGIADVVRDEASTLITSLRKLGWQVGILSGDHPEIVHQVAGKLEIPASLTKGGAAPEDKLALIERCRENWPAVVMIGDGANDAAALAAADVGIAVRGGAEVSLVAAPVYIGSGRLRSIVELFQGSRATTRLIYQTFAMALTYNVVAVAAAWVGWVTPLLAAILMPASSISVVSWTILSRHFRTRS